MDEFVMTDELQEIFKFRCLEDPTKLRVWGDKWSANSDQPELKINTKICTEKQEIECKSKEEIDSFLSGKFIMILINS